MARMKNNTIRRRKDRIMERITERITDRISGRIAGLLLIGMALLLCGCSLAREEGQEAVETDRMIGAYITREYLDLFDMEGYLNDHADQLGGGDIVVDAHREIEYQDRIYAVFQKQDGQGMGEYVFEGIDGIPFFMPVIKSESNPGEDVTAAQQGPEIADGHFTSGDIIKLEGVIYYSGKDSPVFYCNPVYQSPDGSVYMTAGTGISGQLSAGSSYSMKLSETQTASAVNGQQDQVGDDSSDKQGKEKDISSEVNITIQGKAAGGKCRILQMDEDSRIISIREIFADGVEGAEETEGGEKTEGVEGAEETERAEKAEGAEETGEAREIAESEDSGIFIIEENTAYIIVESYGKEDKEAERELFNLGEDENYISIYAQGEDGIVLKKDILTERREK